MQNEKRDEQFYDLFTGIAELYDKDPSPAIFEIWFQALARFEFEDISRAFSIHTQDPDAGRFMPKPADIIKILEGSTSDASYLAWTKIKKTIGTIGSYETVVFDDPIIHRVIQDMGGWIRICQTSEDEMPFVGNEFRRRYQGFRVQRSLPEYPSKLVGIVEGENSAHGHLDQIPAPCLIGDHGKAMAVLEGGSTKPSLQISRPEDGAKRLKLLSGGLKN